MHGKTHFTVDKNSQQHDTALLMHIQFSIHHPVKFLNILLRS